MALAMNGEESPRVHMVSSFALNTLFASGVTVAVTDSIELAEVSREKMLEAIPLVEGKVPKITNKINMRVLPAVTILQTCRLSEGCPSQAISTLEMREAPSIGSRSVISTVRSSFDVSFSNSFIGTFFYRLKLVGVASRSGTSIT